MTYSEIYKIASPKEQLFATIDRINELKALDSIIGSTLDSKRELENLEVLKMNAYSDWKD